MIIKSVLESEENIDSEADILSLGLDSINFVQLVVELEEQFGFEFDDNMLTYDKFKNVNYISDYILSKINKI